LQDLGAPEPVGQVPAQQAREAVADEEGGKHQPLGREGPVQLLRHGQDASGQVGPVGVGDEDGRAGEEEEGPGRRGGGRWGKGRWRAGGGVQATVEGGEGRRGGTELGAMKCGRVLWRERGRVWASG